MQPRAIRRINRVINRVLTSQLLSWHRCRHRHRPKRRCLPHSSSSKRCSNNLRKMLVRARWVPIWWCRRSIHSCCSSKWFRICSFRIIIITTTTITITTKEVATIRPKIVAKTTRKRTIKSRTGRQVEQRGIRQAREPRGVALTPTLHKTSKKNSNWFCSSNRIKKAEIQLWRLRSSRFMMRRRNLRDLWPRWSTRFRRSTSHLYSISNSLQCTKILWSRNMRQFSCKWTRFWRKRSWSTYHTWQTVFSKTTIESWWKSRLSTS